MAEADGNLYVVGYSWDKKKAFFSPILVQSVKDVSFSDEEYVTDVDLLQKMESQFAKHLVDNNGIKISDYTIAVRGAYKKKAFATKRLKKEMRRFRKKGCDIRVVTNFKYSD